MRETYDETRVYEFIRLNGSTITHLRRVRQQAAYGGTCDILHDVWALGGESHRYMEIGTFTETLRAAAPVAMRVAAAIASPREVSEMLCHGLSLGRLIAVGSLGRAAINDNEYADPRRFVNIDIDGSDLRFFTYMAEALQQGGDSVPHGVWKVVFSLVECSVAKHEPIPKMIATRRT